MTQVIIRHVTAKASPIFQCSGCGSEMVDSTVTVELTDLYCNPYMIGEFIRKTFDEGVHPQNMPVGWASYGRSEFRCPKCAK